MSIHDEMRNSIKGKTREASQIKRKYKMTFSYRTLMIKEEQKQRIQVNTHRIQKLKKRTKYFKTITNNSLEK